MLMICYSLGFEQRWYNLLGSNHIRTEENKGDVIALIVDLFESK